MSEIIKIRDRTSGSHFLVASVTELEDNLRLPLVTSGDPWEVTFQLNGVDIPFASTLKDIYNRINKDVDERAKQMAVEMFNERIKDRLFDAISEFEDKFLDSLNIDKE